jgi:sugar lactone lactonase YvrE
MNEPMAGYWPSPWPAEDNGPSRQATSAGALSSWSRESAEVVSRDAHGATMIVLRAPGEVFLHGHHVDDRTTCWVERINPTTLETQARIDDLPGGRRWPGGIAAHADGSLIVVFGQHVHRLSADLELVATRQLPRDRPYNSFVVLPDGNLVTKDFGGLLPGETAGAKLPGTQLLVLDPVTLETIASADLPEPSIARLSADVDNVYVVGNESLFRLTWNGTDLVHDEAFVGRYRTIPGQTHGWDAVLAAGAAWFLDNGAGAENYAGTFRDVGRNEAPLHLVRVALDSGVVTLSEICGLPNGVIANPPLIDADRGIAVGYDSGNGIMTAFEIDNSGEMTVRWSVEQNHASHMVLDPTSGLMFCAHHDNVGWMEQLVVRDISTGEDKGRIDSGSPLQSVVFPSVGFGRMIYMCSFSTVSALSW